MKIISIIQLSMDFFILSENGEISNVNLHESDSSVGKVLHFFFSLNDLSFKNELHLVLEGLIEMCSLFLQALKPR